jgi:5,10-methylenetetrahydromethanopterin reductase
MADQDPGGVGIELWTAGGNVPGQAGLIARRAEADGFDGISFGDTQCLNADPFVGLTAAAGVTSRMKLAVGVTNPLTRHPAVTACAIASVQAESGGRAVLGIGRGDSAVARLGMRAATVAQLERYLVRLQGYLAGDVVDIDGHGSSLQWLRAQELPKVPVDVAATGPAVIAVGARLAERVTFNVGADRARLVRAIALARQAREEAASPPDALSLGAYVNVVPHDDREVAHELIKAVLAVYARFSGMPGHPVELLDPADASVITALAEQYDGSRHARSDAPHTRLLDERFVERFGVAGPPEYCVERLAGLVALGLDRLAIVGPARDQSPDRAAESRHLLVDVVLPGLRRAVGAAS